MSTRPSHTITCTPSACAANTRDWGLLKHVTRRCDAESAPAYLESSSPRNVPLYQRHGFEITGEQPIGEGGPPLYLMWREPCQ